MVEALNSLIDQHAAHDTNNQMMHDIGNQMHDMDYQINDEKLDLAKRYIALAGGMESARDLLDKLEECGECLDIEPDDSGAIESIGKTIPSTPDLPVMSNMPSSSSDPGNPGRSY